MIFAQNVYYIFVARLLHGIGAGGIFSLAQLFFVEISNDKYKKIGFIDKSVAFGG